MEVFVPTLKSLFTPSFFPSSHQELEAEKSLRVSSQKAEAQAVMQHQLAKLECERLKQEIQQLRKQ